MRKNYTVLKCFCWLIFCLTGILPSQAFAQCPPISIVATDTTVCAGGSTTLTIMASVPDTGNISTPVINNNGQDGNMFDISASPTSDITIRYFEGNIANTPSATTSYYIYYKVGTLVGSETNSAAWTLVAGPLSFNPNVPNTFTRIPYLVNITIPAGQTYGFYLTNTSAITNNNRYHSGTATGTVLSTNSDLTVYEGTGGAYPFGTFFNARPWEGRVIYSKGLDYSWNTGPTTQSITVAPGTTTTYIGSVNYNLLGCDSHDTLVVDVTAGSSLDIGPDTTLCQTTLTLDAGPGAISYAWSSGGSSQLENVTASGTYIATVLDTVGCTLEDSIVVTMNPLPIVTVGADIVRCSNAPCSPLSSAVTGAPNPYSYQWSPALGLDDETLANPCADPSATTNYALQVTSSDGCTNLADTVSEVLVAVNPSPVVQLGTDATYCTGSSLPLDAGAGFSSYAWSPSASTQTITVSSPGTYSVTVTDGSNCSGSDTINVSEIQAPVAGFSDTPNGLVVAFTNSSTQATTYLWTFGDGQNSTAANPSHTYTTGGSYVVTLVVTNACGSDTTTTTIVITGVENALSTMVDVFPNPSQGTFHLAIHSLTAEHADVSISSMLGEIVYAKELGAVSGDLQLDFQLGDLAKGVYFLSLHADGQSIVQKVVLH